MFVDRLFFSTTIVLLVDFGSHKIQKSYKSNQSDMLLPSHAASYTTTAHSWALIYSPTPFKQGIAYNEEVFKKTLKACNLNQCAVQK